MTKKVRKITVGITCGDINGVGMETVLKTFQDGRMLDSCTPIIYTNIKATNFTKKALRMNDLHLNYIKEATEAKGKKINVLEVAQEDVRVDFGQSTQEAGALSFTALERATKDIASNFIDIMVTAPINKENIQSESFQFPGHTEYLASYANEENPLMIMVYNGLRVGVVTGHVPLKDVANHVTSEKIITKLQVFNKSLTQDFEIVKPKIAVLGMNPHNGDNGLIGGEEQEVINPALKKAKDEGILCFGPFSADGFFGSNQWQSYDGVLAMYHDQGLVPFKTISFDEGINFTAGLPIVRTSPDHGTAYDIAGTGKASHASLRNAIYNACDIYNSRKRYRAMSSNPLVSRGNNER